MFSESNKVDANDLASSVLPTPVGPKNKKLPIGLLGSLIPALALTTASATKSTALSWPTTRSCSISARFSNFSLSVSTNLETGIPVHELTISPISSSVTISLIIRSLSPFCSYWNALPFLVIPFQVLVFYHVVILLLFLSYSCSQHLLMLFYFHLIQCVSLEA